MTMIVAYRSHVGKIVDGKEKILHPTCRQCPFCENVFAKSTLAMKKHTKVCAAKEGITYTFDNGDIISFQDNFKYMGDVPFTVYFDFEITTGNAVFLCKNVLFHVVPYCQIYAFHPSLNLKKIVIFRSFQQSADEIYSRNHFNQEHVAFLIKQHFFSLKRLLQLFWSVKKQLL